MKLGAVKDRAQAHFGSLRQGDPDLQLVRLDLKHEVLHVFTTDFAGGDLADGCGAVVGVDYGLTYVKRQCVYLWLRRFLTRHLRGPDGRAHWGRPSPLMPGERCEGSAEAVPAHG
ncbi:hypothetical protein GCM10009688_00850 [Arthrobacter gandavensis]|uniref:Uncharacterized protein n=1 Tax=Arthrobacter gandavensis TaxID=169960 RepID=A0ABN2NSK6_9MICC